MPFCTKLSFLTGVDLSKLTQGNVLILAVILLLKFFQSLYYIVIIPIWSPIPNQHKNT